MPKRDGTGPAGMGSMTGRGLGNCITYGIPALAGAAIAFGFGRRRGWFGHGFGQGLAKGLGRGFFGGENNFSSNEELSTLKDQARSMEEGLKEIQNRISELEQK